MAKNKINDRKLLKLVDMEGMSQAEAARQLGCSRQAVSKRLQELKGRTTKAVVLKKVDQVVEQKLDTIQQLTKINTDANELLDLCMKWQRGDEAAIQVLESQVKTIRVGKSEETVKEFKFKDPRDIALKAMAEIRNQLRLQLEIYQTLYDLKAVKEFQETILDTIAEVSPDVRNEIIRRLNEKRVVRAAVKFY